jgi:hypothetical protein
MVWRPILEWQPCAGQIKPFGYRNVYKTEKLGKKTFVVGHMLRFLLMEYPFFITMLFDPKRYGCYNFIYFLLCPILELDQGL